MLSIGQCEKIPTGLLARVSSLERFQIPFPECSGVVVGGVSRRLLGCAGRNRRNGAILSEEKGGAGLCVGQMLREEIQL